MSKVYLVISDGSCCGVNPEGVYSTRENALLIAEGNAESITHMELDQWVKEHKEGLRFWRVKWWLTAPAGPTVERVPNPLFESETWMWSKEYLGQKSGSVFWSHDYRYMVAYVRAKTGPEAIERTRAVYNKGPIDGNNHYEGFDE